MRPLAALSTCASGRLSSRAARRLPLSSDPTFTPSNPATRVPLEEPSRSPVMSSQSALPGQSLDLDRGRRAAFRASTGPSSRRPPSPPILPTDAPPPSRPLSQTPCLARPKKRCSRSTPAPSRPLLAIFLAFSGRNNVPPLDRPPPPRFSTHDAPASTPIPLTSSSTPPDFRLDSRCPPFGKPTWHTRRQRRHRPARAGVQEAVECVSFPAPAAGSPALPARAGRRLAVFPEPFDR